MLQEHLSSLQPAAAIHRESMTVIPLVLSKQGKPDYLTLDEALAHGEVRITEVSDSGSVPELLLHNNSDHAVLLVDGEELVGAKQNRVLNLTILGSAHQVMTIPVSCVEEGRWSESSPAFHSASRTFYAAGRARKADQVTESLRQRGDRRSSQDEVWADIRQKSQRMGSHSATEAVAALYEDRQAQLDGFVDAIKPLPDQIGAVFVIHGEIRGLELFDYPQTLAKLYPKLIQSYALDALDEKPRPEQCTLPDIQAFLRAVGQTGFSSHRAVGEGEDLRLESPEITGGALQARGRLIHLSAFRRTNSRDSTERNADSIENRAQGAMLGHACGDRFGASLEFVSDRSVRTRPVELGNWTDDTHMSLYLGEAILAHGGGQLDPYRFGSEVGEAFLKWLHDPLTPSTAPGNTCLTGARNFEASRDWNSSGVDSSDGCGAVMRVVPLALAFEGEDLLRAARISARITHAHPNAVEAAMAGAWMVQRILDTGHWSAELVLEAIEHLIGPWNQGGTVSESLRAAVAWAARGEDWLDEEMIPPGDGGWRSGSALGLAVAAALRWSSNLELAVEKAARIKGDSDSVACLTGALLGAAGGVDAIPSHWLETLPQHREIRSLAGRLVQQAQQTTAAGTCESPLFAIADIHGHLDLFEKLLSRVDADFPEARIVVLGDYVDNGPQIPQVIDRMIELRAERPDRFFPILGNHDLALLRSLGWPGDKADGDWYDRWASRYWNYGGSTPAAYGAHDLASFERKFPLAHFRFLASLPWYYDDGTYFCVHAGLHTGAIGPQREALRAKTLPAGKFHLPDAIRDKKTVAQANDPDWDRILVSSHVNLKSKAGIVASKHLRISATSDHGEGLLGVMLPELRCWRAKGDRVTQEELI